MKKKTLIIGGIVATLLIATTLYFVYTNKNPKTRRKIFVINDSEE